ncbi:MAG: MBL fold metallo-hydrolase [Atopobiaceae bacterium]|jgi:glyoxylase-like metal-dependent hydrolase (beta-lactamase superfamily II)/predicted amino acid-binding ACT domain protein|nr:MBL fold metallo-hydrolase [Atopobiaceae bacterium]
MKRTFTTIMPDQVGAFLAASRIFASLGLNITRVSYNKAVDTHTLFIEAEGDEGALDDAAGRLQAIGYLPDDRAAGDVILIEFRLRDRPGVVGPVLELIDSFSFNISYISSQENGTDYQHFRMGLFVEDGASVARFLERAARLCDVSVVDYDPTGIALDNTVFYMSFANRIAERFGLGEEEKRRLVIDSNLVMETLSRRNEPPYRTFDTIGKYADALASHGGAAFSPRITSHDVGEGLTATLLEPPCGSNLCVLETGDGLLCVDGGFPCYRDETVAILRERYPRFDEERRVMLLTHADIDHCGLVGDFDEVRLSQTCLENFEREHAGRDSLREQNPLHAPYCRISEVLSGYRPVPLGAMRPIGGRAPDDDGLLVPIGRVDFGPLSFEAHEGAGGHIAGEVVYVERRLRIAFTGDIFVNIKGFTADQAAFNRLAPYLMTSVDSDPALAARERDAVFALLGPGEWTLFGGHGAAMRVGR